MLNSHIGKGCPLSTETKPNQEVRTNAISANKKINVIDLFSGCGGLSYGFNMAGFNVLLGVDHDKKALETFEANHPGAKTLLCDISNISYEADIKKIIGDAKIDIIIGGPPCQGMSLSGPRKFDDPRNILYLSFIRLVREIQPDGFLIENVPGLASLFQGSIKDDIISRFTNLGYHVNYQIVNAADYGVPQKRRRVIFVGLRNGVYTFPDTQCEIVTTSMAIDDLPPLIEDLGEEFVLYDSKPNNLYQKHMREQSDGIHNHVRAKHTDRVEKIISLVPDGGNYKDLPSEYRNTRNFHVAWTRFNSNQPAPTIDTGHRHHFHYKYNRVPTVRECARLQSFPDRFIFIGNKTQQFRQVGNAVPPLLAFNLAKQLTKKLKE